MRNLETYIFDQDGTLYQRGTPLGQALSNDTRDWLLAKITPVISFDELRRRFPNFTDALDHYGLNLPQWQTEVCDPLSEKMSCLIEPDPSLVDFLDSLAGSKYLVTLSSAQFTHALLQVLGIGGHFKRVFNLNSKDKGLAYAEIQGVEGVDPQKIGVFGDNEDIDLNPARRQGMETFFVDSNRSITEQF